MGDWPAWRWRFERPEGRSSRAQEIEKLAGQRFKDVGLDDIADHEPPVVGVLDGYAAAGRSWVATDAADQPFGYVLVDIVDGAAHVEQLSVCPDHQRQGAARRLLDGVGAWALENGMSAITLTTFTHVPWNRPLFEHLGFTVLRQDELGPGLREIRHAETARSLDPTLRVCMRRYLGTRDARADAMTGCMRPSPKARVGGTPERPGSVGPGRQVAVLW